MKLKKIIIEEIQNIIDINEYNQQDSFLSNFETAKKYAYDHIDDVGEAFDNYNENPDDINTKYVYNNYIELIDLYVDKYNELTTEDEITIYRLIILPSLNDLDVKDIGSHWSFDVDGVGNYGGSHPKSTNVGNSYVLEGIVNPNDIDWVYGFSSFIWYGEDQWECALNKNAKVLITKINDETIEPINAVVGSS